MKRRLANTTAAISLTLCLATAMLWARSDFDPTFDALPEVLHGDGWLLQSWRGRLFVNRVHVVTPGSSHVLVLIRAPDGIAQRMAAGIRPARERAIAKARNDPQSSIWTPFPAAFSPAGLANGFGFEFRRAPAMAQGSIATLAIPWWSIVSVTAVLPLRWLMKHPARRWARRAGQGRCARCGYNLTGNASGVCPECGTPVPKLARWTIAGL